MNSPKPRATTTSPTPPSATPWRESCSTTPPIPRGAGPAHRQFAGAQLQNYTLLAIHTGVEAAGCEFTDASYGIVGLIGGTHSFSHCTFANYYLFTALEIGRAARPPRRRPHLRGRRRRSAPYLSATFTNSIIYGNGGDISHGDLDFSQVYLYRCLLKSNGTDDHFVDCLWGKDPQYYTRREDYHFDYRLKPTSPAAAAGLPEYTSPLTPPTASAPPLRHHPTLGAYQLPD